MKVDNRAASLILVDGNKALMMLRDDKPGISFPGKWAIVGGSCESGESFLQTAIKELKEETGYQAKAPQLFMTEKYYQQDGRLIGVARFFEIYDRVQKIDCFEGQKMEFKTMAEIDRLKAVVSHAYAAKKAILLASKKSGT